MIEDPDIARIAALFADPARAKILRTLMDGASQSAGALANTANISAQSASAHLAKLVHGGLLLAEPDGRHRYFRIASSTVADAIETFASLSLMQTPKRGRDSSNSTYMTAQFAYSRTCYDHMAGQIAVEICSAMLKARWLAIDGRNFKITPSGEEKLIALNIDVAAAQRSRRLFARVCIDLTQRRPHIGGVLGAALLSHSIANGWILRSGRSRVTTITPKGNEAFRITFLA
jgi:DNA-binding transcriptional ArsR family regulator